MPQRSPMPLIVPCTCVDALGHRGQRVGDGHIAVVVAVNAQLRSQLLPHRVHDRGHVVGQRAAVGVAQDEDASPGLLGGTQRLQGIRRDCAR